MNVTPVTFYSEGFRLVGDLYAPGDLRLDERRAEIVLGQRPRHLRPQPTQALHSSTTRHVRTHPCFSPTTGTHYQPRPSGPTSPISADTGIAFIDNATRSHTSVLQPTAGTHSETWGQRPGHLRFARK